MDVSAPVGIKLANRWMANGWMTNGRLRERISVRAGTPSGETTRTP